MPCYQCHSNNLERATLIVDRESSSGSGTAYGGADVGTITTYTQSKTPRAARLTADEPQEAKCLGTGIILVLVGVLLLGCTLPLIRTELLAVTVLVDPIVIVAAIIIGIVMKRGYKRRYRAWYQGPFSRRWYCNNCGAINQS